MSAGGIGGAVAASLATNAKGKETCPNAGEMLERAEETGALLEQTLAERKEATEQSRRRLCLLKAKLKAAMGFGEARISPEDGESTAS